MQSNDMEIIDKLDEYIENPELVTKETLTQLKEEIMKVLGMDEGMDEDMEDDMEDEDMEGGEGKEKGGLVITIGRKMHGGK